jgi:hypothetical protein
MNIQERELELKYLNKIIDRQKERGDALYEKSVDYKYTHYAFEASSNGTYDPAEEERLEEEALKWRKSEEAKEYIKIIEDLVPLITLRNKLEQEQVDCVIEKYNLKGV